MVPQPILSIIRSKYGDYACKVVWHFKRYGPGARQSGADTHYKNVWQEYVAQVQGEEGIFYDLYEQEIERLCLYVLKRLPRSELQLLWFGSDAYINWELDDDQYPADDELLQAIIDELRSRVWKIAADEELDEPSSDDDY
jgi:hypothetical protein